MGSEAALLLSLPPSLSLSGRVAIVTGGSRGIGRASALELARRGASIAIVYNSASSTKIAADLVTEIISLDPEGKIKATAIQANIRDANAGKRIVEETLKGLKSDRIDILVHNAGVFVGTSTLDNTIEGFASSFETNVRGPLLLTQAAIPYMPRGEHGRIIIISSISARSPEMGLHNSLYAASKAAMESMCRSWSQEFGHSHGITVNCVAPGLVDTDFLASVPEPQLSRLVAGEAAATAAAGRIGAVDDVAQSVAWLASEGSRWVTGTTMGVNGGRKFY